MIGIHLKKRILPTMTCLTETNSKSFIQNILFFITFFFFFCFKIQLILIKILKKLIFFNMIKYSVELFMLTSQTNLK